MPKKYKKILTIDDLINFCQEQKFSRFSSKETGYQLAVKVPTTFEIDENVDKNHRGMMKLKFRIFHTGLNRNQSFISKEAATKAMNTIADRPVLAAIHQLDDGTWDFEGHEMEVVTDENGKEELRYIESQVGSFSSEPAFWEHDNETDKDYICAYAYISREYTKACEIIERKNGTKNSCELFVDELAYNAKKKYLDLIDFYVNASTLLGSRSDGTEIKEGMQGSRADIADFSVEKNSIKFSKDDKLIEILDKLNNTLSEFNINNNSTKGGNTVDKNKVKFKEVTESDKVTESEEISKEEVTVTENEAEDAVDEISEEVIEETTEDTVEVNESVNTVEYSFVSKGETRKFAVSLQEKIYAIQDLVNATYAESDNTYYGVTVFDEYVIMQDWWNGRYFKQSYTSENDNYSLIGDRIEVYVEYVTADEQKELDSMRSNYAALKEFKETAEKKELHLQRESIINSEKYAVLTEKDENGTYINEAFSKLVSEMDNYSLSDLETQIKVIHSDYIAEHVKFTATNNADKAKMNSVRVFANPNNKAKPKKRYGDLFD